MPAAQAERTLEDPLAGLKLESVERARICGRTGSIRLVCGGSLRSLTLIDRPHPHQMRQNGSRECHGQCQPHQIAPPNRPPSFVASRITCLVGARLFETFAEFAQLAEIFVIEIFGLLWSKLFEACDEFLGSDFGTRISDFRLGVHWLPTTCPTAKTRHQFVHTAMLP
jgi:hypothetical protein